jgi:hypothetical protein
MTINQRTGVSTFASRPNPSTDQSLQKSFHLSHADKIETVYGSRTPLKIKYEVSNLKKSPPLQKIKNTQPRRPTLHRQRW